METWVWDYEQCSLIPRPSSFVHRPRKTERKAWDCKYSWSQDMMSCHSKALEKQTSVRVRSITMLGKLYLNRETSLTSECPKACWVLPKGSQTESKQWPHNNQQQFTVSNHHSFLLVYVECQCILSQTRQAIFWLHQYSRSIVKTGNKPMVTMV